MAAYELMRVCHGLAKAAGWWSSETARDVPRLLMLCVSELAEAMEGDRKQLKDDKLPHRDMLEVELADCLIRIFDMAGGLNLDISGALVEKLKFNATREDHKPENRAKEGGKKY
jgi:NTP pyrophosphatase (non-canonical NTP hydrolase)